jgi:hypothetical protein
MKTYKYKQKQINYKGQKHKVNNCKCKAPKQDNYNQLQSPWKNKHKAQQKIHASTKKTTNYRQKNKACKENIYKNAKKSKRKKNEEEEEE